MTPVNSTLRSIFFFHIPKTAGTALQNLFATRMGDDRVTRPLAMRMDEALTRHAEASAICGHFFVEQGQKLPRDRVSLTVLRNPVDRFLSYFYFRKHNVERAVIDHRVHSLDVEAFIDKLGEADLEELNLQTTMLCPLGTSTPAMLSLPERVAAAKRAVDSFDLVGVHEEIDDFVCMICARRGWPAETSLSRINVTSRQQPEERLSMRARSKLERLMQHDHEVYEHAAMRFRQSRRASIAGSTSHALVRHGVFDSSLPPSVPHLPAREQMPPDESGNHHAELLHASASGQISGDNAVLIGEQLNVHIDLVVHEPLDEFAVAFLIRDEWNVPVFGTNTYLLGDAYSASPGTYRITFSFINRVGPGTYLIDASLSRVNPSLLRKSRYLQDCLDLKKSACRFNVYGWATPHFEGRVMMDVSAEVIKTSPLGRVEVLDVPPKRPGFTFSIGTLNLPLRDFSARVCMLGDLPTAPAGMELLIELEIENTGCEIWRVNGKQPVCLSYHWHDLDGNVIVFDGLRTRFPRDVHPGNRVRLIGLLQVPMNSGAARLTWTLVQEHVAWFDQAEPAAQCHVDVLVS